MVEAELSDNHTAAADSLSANDSLECTCAADSLAEAESAEAAEAANRLAEAESTESAEAADGLAEAESTESAEAADGLAEAESTESAEAADGLAEAESTEAAEAADSLAEAERPGSPSPAKSPEEVYVEALLAAGKGDAGNKSAQPQEAAMPAKAEPAGQNTLEARMLYVQQQIDRWVSHILAIAYGVGEEGVDMSPE